jgi:hypothetical protein
MLLMLLLLLLMMMMMLIGSAVSQAGTHVERIAGF